MVLAAGLGQRMRPLTLLRAKPALPVLGRPLIAHTLERLARAGVREVVVNLHHLPETVTRALARSRPPGMRIRYAREPEILGTGGGPRAVRAWLGREPILLVNGDVWFDFDLRALVARHRAARAQATLALRRLRPGERYSPVVTGGDGRILSIAGRPRPARGSVSMFTGVHVLDPALLERLPEGFSDSVAALYVPLIAERGAVFGVRPKGAWYDLGRPALYRDAQLRVLQRLGARRSAAAGAHAGTVRASVLAEDARVEPQARVERSILWEGARVEAGARVAGSVLTSRAVVRAGERARNVIVMPLEALRGGSGERFERRGDMAWVEIE
jgi:NDP-sugar pyrophosphorylase family protein